MDLKINIQRPLRPAIWLLSVKCFITLFCVVLMLFWLLSWKLHIPMTLCYSNSTFRISTHFQDNYSPTVSKWLRQLLTFLFFLLHKASLIDLYIIFDQHCKIGLNKLLRWKKLGLKKASRECMWNAWGKTFLDIDQFLQNPLRYSWKYLLFPLTHFCNLFWKSEYLAFWRL